MKEHIESNLKIISNPEKTVAVFIRSGQHFNKYNYIEDIIEELKVVMKNYDKLFLVTTVMPFIEKITTVFGDKVCFLSDKNMTKNDNDDWGCYRTNPNSPWIMKNMYAPKLASHQPSHLFRNIPVQTCTYWEKMNWDKRHLIQTMN